MSADFSGLKEVLAKLEAADLPILEAALLPAMLDAAVSALPAADQTIAKDIESAALPVLQTGLAALIAKLAPAQAV